MRTELSRRSRWSWLSSMNRPAGGRAGRRSGRGPGRPGRSAGRDRRVAPRLVGHPTRDRRVSLPTSRTLARLSHLGGVGLVVRRPARTSQDGSLRSGSPVSRRSTGLWSPRPFNFRRRVRRRPVSPDLGLPSAPPTVPARPDQRSSATPKTSLPNASTAASSRIASGAASAARSSR